MSDRGATSTTIPVESLSGTLANEPRHGSEPPCARSTPFVAMLLGTAMIALISGLIPGTGSEFATIDRDLVATQYEKQDQDDDASQADRAAQDVDTTNQRDKVEGHWGEDAIGFAWQEEDSVDGRWQETAIGPCLAATIHTGRDFVQKGLIVNLAGSSSASVCYDTRFAGFAGLWYDGFLLFDPARYGLIQHPKPAGTVQFTSAAGNPWSSDDVRWNGYEQFGHELILDYEVGGSRIREWPRLIEQDSSPMIVRNLKVSPSAEDLTYTVWDRAVALEIREAEGMAWAVSKTDTQVSMIGLAVDQSASCRLEANQETLRLVMDRSEDDRRLALVYLTFPAEESADWLPEIEEAIFEAIDADFPGEYATIWGDALSTALSTAPPVNGYAIDTFEIPFDNPYGALMFISGHDFFRDGSAAICTVHGDVWLVDGLDANPTDDEPISWRRFATGLYQPLGLCIVDDQVYVLGRDQITRLHDRNQDGEADLYENFNNAGDTSIGTHDYAACLETDSQGNFYYVRGNTGLERVTADGQTHKLVATGLRNPNGMGVGPNDVVTVAPQEGEWTPASFIAMVTDGDHFGFRGPVVTDDRPTGVDEPLCWLPRLVDNSSGGQVWVDSQRWGPLRGRMLHLSYGRCWMMVVLEEEVAGHHQGGVVQFPLVFDSGVCRGRFRKQDGQLYVSGLKGWSSSAVKDGCFQRVRYVQYPFVPTGVRTVTNGVVIEFSEPLDQQAAINRFNYFAQRWNYRYSSEYGSPEFSVAHPGRLGRDDVRIISATLQPDGKSVFLELEDHQPVMQLAISFSLRAESGRTLSNTLYQTIHHVGSDALPPGTHAMARAPSEDSLNVGDLSSGITVSTFAGEALQDRWIARLVTVAKNSEGRVSVFSDDQSDRYVLEGYLLVSAPGTYAWQASGTAGVRLWIDSTEIAAIQEETLISENEIRIGFDAMEMERGYVPIRVEVSELPVGGTFGLKWKSDSFGWEPIRPVDLYHLPGDLSLNEFDGLRNGRELFVTRGCVRCHGSGQDAESTTEALRTSTGMHALTWHAPRLDGIGKDLNPRWVEEWILNPHHFKPDAEMPAILDPSFPEDRQVARDIAAWLVTLGHVNQSSRAATVDHEALDEWSNEDDSEHALEEGERIYERRGCIACHHFRDPHSPDEHQRHSLALTTEKYQPAGLVRYLMDPHRRHPASRMPQFELSLEEAMNVRHLLYVETASSQVVTYDNDLESGDADAGREAFITRGCAQCHMAGEASEFAPPATPLAFDQPGSSGCLDPLSSLSRHIPQHRLSVADRTSVLEFLRHGTESLSWSVPGETAQRLIQRLNCTACHEMDRMHSKLPEIALFEGWSGHVPEEVPSLTYAGEKLHTDWMQSLVQGEFTQPTREWLEMSMPAFPAYAEVLGEGIASQHGYHRAEREPFNPSMQLGEQGRQLTEPRHGFDCRQCHGVGDSGPTGDEDTQLALGVNFNLVRARLRKDYYDRWMIDPHRFDRLTKMPRYSADGVTTQLDEFWDGDAQRQFEAIWHYLMSVDQAEQ